LSPSFSENYGGKAFKAATGSPMRNQKKSLVDAVSSKAWISREFGGICLHAQRHHDFISQSLQHLSIHR
jgi:hypothetical protein